MLNVKFKVLLKFIQHFIKTQVRVIHGIQTATLTWGKTKFSRGCSDTVRLSSYITLPF